VRFSRQVILIVDDNSKDVELTVRALNKSEVRSEIVVVRDGAEALDYLFADETLADGGGRVLPSLILLDLKLPKIDGLEVLRRVRTDARTKHLPVVILTTSNEDGDLIEGYRLGANSYVRKPVDFDRFVDVAAQLGCYWLTLNELPPLATE